MAEEESKKITIVVPEAMLFRKDLDAIVRGEGAEKIIIFRDVQDVERESEEKRRDVLVIGTVTLIVEKTAELNLCETIPEKNE